MKIDTRFNYFLIKFAQLYPIGKIQFGQGTFASLFAILFGYYLLLFLNTFTFFIIILFLFSLSLISINRYLIKYKKQDPPEVVSDELIGQLISLLPIPILNIEISFNALMISFLTFRFFDISKIGLKSIEKIQGSWGVMLDDVFAGIYSCVIQIIIWKYLIYVEFD